MNHTIPTKTVLTILISSALLLSACGSESALTSVGGTSTVPDTKTVAAALSSTSTVVPLAVASAPGRYATLASAQALLASKGYADNSKSDPPRRDRIS